MLHYKRLGLGTNATEEEIRSAYLCLLLKNYPNRSGNLKTLLEIQESYSILSNKEKRDVYNNYGETDINLSLTISRLFSADNMYCYFISIAILLFSLCIVPVYIFMGDIVIPIAMCIVSQVLIIVSAISSWRSLDFIRESKIRFLLVFAVPTAFNLFLSIYILWIADIADKATLLSSYLIFDLLVSTIHCIIMITKKPFLCSFVRIGIIFITVTIENNVFKPLLSVVYVFQFIFFDYNLQTNIFFKKNIRPVILSILSIKTILFLIITLNYSASVYCALNDANWAMMVSTCALNFGFYLVGCLLMICMGLKLKRDLMFY